MKKLFLLSVIVFLITSCGSQEPEIINVENNQTESLPKAEVFPNAVADIAIEGMVCELGCVNAVRKELLKLDGVASMDIEFNADTTINHAFVKFDDQIIKKEKIIAAIEDVNDHQYKVKESSVSEIKTESNNESVKESVPVEKSTDEEAYEIPEFSLSPGIFDALIQSVF